MEDDSLLCLYLHINAVEWLRFHQVTFIYSDVDVASSSTANYLKPEIEFTHQAYKTFPKIISC